MEQAGAADHDPERDAGDDRERKARRKLSSVVPSSPESVPDHRSSASAWNVAEGAGTLSWRSKQADGDLDEPVTSRTTTSRRDLPV